MAHGCAKDTLFISALLIGHPQGPFCGFAGQIWLARRKSASLPFDPPGVLYSRLFPVVVSYF